MAQQPLLDGDRRAAARVHEAADAVTRNHAVAGNDERNAVGAARAADRSRRAFYLACDVEIGQRVAARDSADRAPHAALERGAVEFVRQIKPELGIVEIAFELAAYLRGKPVDRRERRDAARQIFDAGQPFAGGADAEHREWRGELCGPAF